ncbi:ADP-ribosylation factor-like protein 5A-like protein, partial [Pavlovales sp. CCMP2436]
QVWDLGGQERLRKSWGTYYINTNAVILVVDSTDREHMPTVKAELAAITAHEDLANAVLLILANKQDAEGAMTAAEVSTALSLHANKQHDWQIQACCALTGDGLFEGLDWIIHNLRQK